MGQLPKYLAAFPQLASVFQVYVNALPSAVLRAGSFCTWQVELHSVVDMACKVLSAKRKLCLMTGL
jgi:hypothetical protein